MSILYRTLSYYLKERPLLTNLVLSSSVAFGGDVVCQTVYEPVTLCRPPLTRARLPDESASSPFLVQVTPPLLWLKARWRRLCGGPELADASILVDLRRSLIFSSFSFLFGVPFFLWVYRRLDALISPVGITKLRAIGKGAMSYVAAQLTNPLFLTYVTAMDHYFIYRDGRDGRRRVMAAPSVEHPVSPHAAWADGATHHEAGAPPGATTYKMGHAYRFVSDRRFNLHEFVHCAGGDVLGRLRTDFPDIVKYGFLFWSVNWLPMFYYIPSHFRLAYSSALQVVWSGVMSYLLHRKDVQLSHDGLQVMRILGS